MSLSNQQMIEKIKNRPEWSSECMNPALMTYALDKARFETRFEGSQLDGIQYPSPAADEVLLSDIEQAILIVFKPQKHGAHEIWIKHDDWILVQNTVNV